MAYVLGIDLGTSYSAAAIGHDDGRVEIFQLGARSAAIPSLVVIRPDGEVLVGEAAERRALTEPARTAREFKRRLGDPVPIILGGTPFGPDALIAILLRAIVRQVAEQLGAPPERIVLSHPASYGPYKLDLLRQAARQADLPPTTLVPEPVAAAVHYASLERVPTGATVAVYDFGGGTFDATILRKTADGFEAAGEPEGLERLGGADFDEAVFRSVLEAVGAPVRGLDSRDPAVQAGLARLREECRRAKEALSSDSDATILVVLPGIQTEVRITRSELEAMIEPRIAETVGALVRAARSAGVGLAELDHILLVGGTSRIPRIAERVRAATGRPVAVDVHPKLSVALGAARMGIAGTASAGRVGIAGTAAVNAAAPGPAPSPARSGEPAVAARTGGRPGSAAPAPAEPGGHPAPDAAAPSARPAWLVPGLVAAALVALLAAGALLGAGLLGGALPAPSAGATTGTRPTLPPAPTPLPTFAAGGTLAARITGVSSSGDHYDVRFTTTGFTPAMTGNHLHFFWNNVPPEQAGEPAKGPYVVYAGESPFQGFGPGGRPAAATAICVIVAHPDHTVIPGSGACASLP